MTRIPRSRLPPGWFHCINRGANRAQIFFDDDDYRWFVNALTQGAQVFSLTLSTYCIMPNHWHVVLHCEDISFMSSMFKKLLNDQTRRHHAKYQTIGHGPLYQGRFKSFPIKDDEALNVICAYIENNPVRAKLVNEAAAWPWSSR
ncbi:MAG: transposase [Oligoflexales bacterium]